MSSDFLALLIDSPLESQLRNEEVGLVIAMRAKKAPTTLILMTQRSDDLIFTVVGGYS